MVQVRKKISNLLFQHCREQGSIKFSSDVAVDSLETGCDSLESFFEQQPASIASGDTNSIVTMTDIKEPQSLPI